MKVWTVLEPNGAFVEQERAIPEPAKGEVLIRISASGVNPLDAKIRAGNAAHAKQPLPAVLGIDVAGTVERLGEDVAAFEVGDEVYGMAGGVGGLQGSLAEYMVADASLLALKPKNLSMVQSAALPLSVITAWEGLVDRARVSEGKAVLVHGGAGGVGHIVVQLAKAFGATVHATGSKESFSTIESYGAIPIDYQKMAPEDYIALSRDGNGWDIVYDTVGGATLDASFKVAKRYTGHVVSCLGWSTHSLAPLSFRGATYSGVFTLLPLLSRQNRSHHGHILSEARSIAEAGNLVPLLNDRTFRTSEINEAHKTVAEGSKGKVVVAIAADATVNN